MNLKEAIQSLASTNDEVYSVVGTVTAVDAEKRVCDVQPSNGDAELFDVRLQAQLQGEGFLLVPAEGSDVVVTFLNQQTGYVAMCSTLERIELGTEGNQPAVLGDELNDNLAKLIGELENVATAIETHNNAVIAAAGASPPLAPLVAPAQAFNAQLLPIKSALNALKNSLQSQLSELVKIQ